MMSTFSTDALVWSGELSLRHFLEKYGKARLPQLIQTTSGYSDVDNVNDISADEVFWVFGITYQQRVVATTVSNRCVSIPRNYHQKFQKLTSACAEPGPPVSLDELITEGQFEGRRIQLASGETAVLDLSSSTTGECRESLGRLEIIDTYKEKYLLARSIAESGDLCETVVGIPVYLPISIEVAEGIRGASGPGQFAQWLRKTAEVSNSLPEQTTQRMCEDILVFDHRPNGDYEYVNPLRYANMNKSHQPRLPPQPSSRPPLPARVDDDDDESGDYEEIPADYATSAPVDLGSTRMNLLQNKTKEMIKLQQSKSVDVSTNSTPCPKKPPSIQSNVQYPAKFKPPVPLPTSPTYRQQTIQNVDLVGRLQHSNSSSPTCGTSGMAAPSFRQPSPEDFSRSKAPIPRPDQIGVPTQVVFPYNNPPRAQTPGQPAKVSLTSSNAAKNSSARNRPTDGAASPADTGATGQHRVAIDSRSWRKASDIPLNVVDFTVDELSRALELLNMPQLAETFRNASVDGQLMADIVTEDVLISEFRCSTFDARKLIQFVKFNWRPKRSSE